MALGRRLGFVRMSKGKIFGRSLLTLLVGGIVGVWVAAYLDTPYGVMSVRVDGPPHNAAVVTSLGDECVTPCLIRVWKDVQRFDVTLSYSGYKSQTIANAHKNAELKVKMERE